MNTPHNTDEHARFSPSASSRWLACPASILLSEEAERLYGKEPTSPAADMGRKIHALAEKMLKGESIEGLPVPADAEKHLRCYVDEIMAIRGSVLLVGETLIEHIEERLYTEIDDCWGTGDYAAVLGIEAWIVDLKTGRHEVEAEANPQLLIYALALLRKYPALKYIHLIICQAEAGEPKRWTVTPPYLTLFKEQMQRAIGEVRTATPKMGDHCSFCRGKSLCPAQGKDLDKVFAISIPSVSGKAAGDSGKLPSPSGLTDEQRAFIIINRKRIIDFMEAVCEDAIAKPPPGTKVVEVKGRQVWADEDEAVMELEKHGIKPRLKPITIGEAKKKLDDSVLNKLISPGTTRKECVSVDDKRPAIEADVFK